MEILIIICVLRKNKANEMTMVRFNCALSGLVGPLLDVRGEQLLEGDLDMDFPNGAKYVYV